MSRARRRRTIATLFAMAASASSSILAQSLQRVASSSGPVGAREGPEFEWLPTECADERYPMQLIQGEFRAGNRVIDIPAGKIVNNGWGEIGSRRLVGPRFKPVPERLALAWFSYAEDRFFEGTVDLPRAELTALFRAGFAQPSTGKNATWSKIIAGMGLGGWVSVWLAGDALVREVARAQVATAVIDWKRVIDNPDIQRADYVRAKLQSRLGDAALAQLARHGPPVSTWARYSQRYRWRIAVEGPQAPLSLLLRTFNGERSFHDLAGPPPQELSIAPKDLQITWRSRSGGRLLTRIRLDEEEVYAAFGGASAVGAAAPPTTLRVEFTARYQLALSVERGATRLPLTRSRVEVSTLA